jgi:hypothetical protein
MLDAASRRRSLNRRFENILQTLENTGDQAETLTASAKRLLEVLSNLVLFARASVEQRWLDTDGFPEPGREMTRRLTVGDITYLLRELSDNLLPALDGAVSSNVPVEIEALVRRLVMIASDRADLNVILFSSNEINYSIQLYPDPLQIIAPLIAPHMPAPESERTDFLFLRLPRLERDSAALHAVLLGHEIGHLVDWTNTITGGLSPTLPERWLDPDTHDVLPEFAGAYDGYSEVLLNWTSEVVADIVAAITMGPASLLALAELVLSIGQLDGDSNTHPGLDRRAAVILRVLDSHGFREIPQAESQLATFRAPSADALSREVNNARTGTQEAWDWISTNLDDIISRCAVGPAATSTLAGRWEEVTEASARLAEGLPCGERWFTNEDGSVELVAVDESVILNAAWCLWSEGLGGLASVVAVEDSSDQRMMAQVGVVLDGLVLKSLEIAEIRREQPWHQE